MPLDMPIGVTPERKNHSQIILEIRTINNGGMVSSYGNRDIDHCLLDTLYRTGLLGRPGDAQERYSIGLRLRELWYSFNQTGTALEDMGTSSKGDYVSEGEIGVGNDAKEALYNSIMRALPAKYRLNTKALCVEDRWVKNINECLDALHGTFYYLDTKRI